MNLHEVHEAWKRLETVACVTPLLQSKFNPHIYLKTENLQITGSFKIRAAYNQIIQLGQKERDQGIVTSSSGNFAQAVAYASRLQGISAKIVMMKNSNPLKIEATRKWGGEVVFCENHFDARTQTVEQIQKEEGRSTVYPYDHQAAVYGNATIGLEILEQLDTLENLVVPISPYV